MLCVVVQTSSAHAIQEVADSPKVVEDQAVSAIDLSGLGDVGNDLLRRACWYTSPRLPVICRVTTMYAMMPHVVNPFPSLYLLVKPCC